jgi:hypothetical protein
MTTSRPRALLATVLAAAASLGLPGCLQTEEQTTLKANGSGSMTQTWTLDVAKTKEFDEFLKVMGMSGPGARTLPGMTGPMDLGQAERLLMSEEVLRQQLKDTPGVEVKRLVSETKDGRRVTNVDLGFADFAALGKGGFLTTGVELKKNDDGTWTLAFDGLGAMKELVGQLGAGGAGAPGMPAGIDVPALMGMLEPFFSTFALQRKITLPGKIVSTNGTASEDGTSVEWKLGCKDLTAGPAVNDGKGPGYMTVTFRGEALTLTPFVYRADMETVRKRAEAAKKAMEAAAAPKPEPAPALTPSGK